MSDIATALRAFVAATEARGQGVAGGDFMLRAADEIERLRKSLETIRDIARSDENLFAKNLQSGAEADAALRWPYTITAEGGR